ncbi:hypothetical protein TWF696_003719 [Orbilia brochopaga]|uniref:Uncharacterized protein n=1 Tax=Orbilia brochopaga TaxID=3140254 RepID=A0AAV9V3Z4_9PEZI
MLCSGSNNKLAMSLRYHGEDARRAGGEDKMQQGQRKRKRTPLSSSSSFPSSTSSPSPSSSSTPSTTSSTAQVSLHIRQEAVAPASAIPGDGRPSSLILPPSMVIDATTTYTNPGLMVVQQLTTVTESGSTFVRSQITVVDIPASQTPLPVNPTADGNAMTFTALLTDSIGTGTFAMSSTSLRLPSATGASRPTGTGSASASSTAAPQSSDSSDKFNPILISAVIMIVVLGAIIAAVSIFCCRRRKKRQQQRRLEEGRESRKYGKGVMARIDTSRPASHPDDWPLPQAFATVRTNRDVSMMMRKPSTLLPSPLREGSYPEFPIPPHVVRGMPTRFPVQASTESRSQSPICFSRPLTPSQQPGWQSQSWARIHIHADEEVQAQAQAQAQAQVYGYAAYDSSQSPAPAPPPPSVVRHKPVGPLAIAVNGTFLRVESNDKIPYPSPDLHRGGYPSPAALSSPSSRHRSFVSMESAIDPDLSFGANGSRISAQVDGENPNAQYNSFTYWGDYDFSRRPYSTIRSMPSLHDSNVASPRLVALEENSIWEEALMDVEYEARTPTDSTGPIASPRP